MDTDLQGGQVLGEDAIFLHECCDRLGVVQLHALQIFFIPRLIGRQLLGVLAVSKAKVFLQRFDSFRQSIILRIHGDLIGFELGFLLSLHSHKVTRTDAKRQREHEGDDNKSKLLLSEKKEPYRNGVLRQASSHKSKLLLVSLSLRVQLLLQMAILNLGLLVVILFQNTNTKLCTQAR